MIKVAVCHKNLGALQVVLLELLNDLAHVTTGVNYNSLLLFSVANDAAIATKGWNLHHM
eukprot:CAMPEP_0178379538 /NCGR_PEP_ID=MMETSP0689_2-20121128/4995_1 /TAXON_ID=160604 /ORGANISM="Amphidinium massartii, Strain CS-259" /LENGTH=58 /DNA_ID=CAMNT_0019999645 /DNA_START=443 /DNA_END=619 /DNA_ORIENTATION=+